MSALRPSTATITSPLSSAFAAGTSTATASTRTPRGSARTSRPAARIATAAATCSDRFISTRASATRSRNVSPGAVTACAGTSDAPSGRRNGRIRSSQRTFRTVTST